MFFEELDVEHRVQSFQSQGKVKLIGMGGYLPDYLEGAETLVVKLHRGEPD